MNNYNTATQHDIQPDVATIHTDRHQQIKSKSGTTISPSESSEDTTGGVTEYTPYTPLQWFAAKYPKLAAVYGDAVLEVIRDGVVLVRDIGEDFLAATLSADGTPEEPTVFLPTEEKFLRYSPKEGIFIHQREALLSVHLSQLVLECARDCKGHSCNTQNLEFRFRNNANMNGVLRKARGILEVPPDFFSSDLTEFIACQNGMLRLKDRALLPFSPHHRRRNKLDAPYDKDAQCPLFLKTLMRPALDDDDLDLLQRWCGLALIGENVAQRILLLVGTAGGGKGTFIRVLTGIIGQSNLASLRTQLLNERFELGRFLGSTLLYGADVSDKFLDHRAASVLKALTGYDPVALEFKGSNESPRIICRFNVIATCNSRLTVHLEGDTGAWRRRLAIIEYNKPKPDEVIADLDRRILAEESAGVLNWMLDGLDKLRAANWQLNLTANQQARVDNLLLESDSQGVFVRECLKRDDEKSLSHTTCFAAYVDFCTQRGWTAGPRNRFSHVIDDEVVRQFGITTRNDIKDTDGKAQRGWKGLTVTENLPQASDTEASETSEIGTKPLVSDTSDTNSPVGCADNSAEEIMAEALQAVDADDIEVF